MNDNAHIDTNPYIGPLAFQSEQAKWYYGRSQEGDELLSLLLARRLVLFYAQSGAGKTSLLNASLVPSLKNSGNDFEVLPIGRVGDAIDPPDEVNNIFVFNLIASLGLTDHPEKLASLRLSDFLLDLAPDGETFVYVGGREKADQNNGAGELPVGTGEQTLVIKPRALIIDQFEEIFTVHPELEAERVDFFKQVADTLKVDPYLYLVFSMRGDYYDRLTPYVHYLPDSLRTRFYMERMRPEQALMAVRFPAEREQRYFTDEVSKKLVKYLRRLKTADVETFDDEGKLDPYVEAVQLQVVCRQLWQNLETAPGDTITIQDVEAVALRHKKQNRVVDQKGPEHIEPLAVFIDNALADYYEQAIRIVLDDPQVNINAFDLRKWFSNKLITPAKTRNLIAREEKETGGIPEYLIEKLDREHHIIRSDTRGGRPFIELVHDSFIEPILKANQDWKDKRARQVAWLNAALEYAETKNPALLIRGSSLKAAQAQLKIVTDLPGEADEYIAASLEAEKRREDEARRLEDKRQTELKYQQEIADGERKRAEEAIASRIRVRRWVIVAFVISILAVGFGIVAFNASNRAREQELFAVNQAEEAATSEARASNSEAVALQFKATAQASAAIAEANLKNAESLRMADRAEILFEENRIIPALLAGRIAVEITPTEKAVNILSDMLALAHISNPNMEASWQGDPEAMKALACDIAGRNLTAREWEEIFHPESIEESLAGLVNEADSEELAYLTSCREFGFGLHLSFAQKNLEYCNGLETAADLFNLSISGEGGDAGQTAFEEFAYPLLLDAAVSSQNKNCLDLAEIDESDATEFLAIVEELASLSLTPNNVQLLETLQTLDEQRTGLPIMASDALAGLFVEHYGRLCLDINLPFAEARTACERQQGLALNTSTNLLPMNLISETESSRTYAFTGRDGEVVAFRHTAAISVSLISPAEEEVASYTLESNDFMTATHFLLLEAGEFNLHLNFETSEALENSNETDFANLSSPPEENEALESSNESNSNNESEGNEAFDLTITAGVYEIMPLTYDSWLSDVASEQHWWHFEGSEGDRLSIAVNSLDDGDPFIKLIDEDGEVVREDDDGGDGDNALLRIVLEEDKGYFISTGWYGDAERYAISMQSVEPKMIGYDDVIEEAGADELWWSFEGEAGDFVSIAMDAIEDGDPYLYLYDEDNKLITSNDDWLGHNSRIFTQLPANGVYIIEAGWWDDSAEYTLSLNEEVPQEIRIGDTVERESDEVRLWNFTGQRGDYINIVLNVLDGGNTHLQLRDADNKVIASGDYNPDERNEYMATILPKEGSYYIDVGLHNRSEPYSLSLNVIQSEEVIIGETISEAGSDKRLWQFDGQVGEIVSISMDALDEGDPYLRLLDGDKVTLATNDDGGPGLNSVITFRLPETGTYYIDADWLDLPGRYSLSVLNINPQPLPFNQTMAATSDQEWWQFNGQKGNVISVTMIALGNGEPSLRLLNESSRELTRSFDEFSQTVELQYLITADGQYYIEAGWSDVAGDYNLSITLIEPERLDFGDTFDTINGDDGWWQFEGRGGDFVAISMNALDEGDPYLNLLDENGNVIATDNDSGTDFNASAYSILPADGIYYIDIGWYSDKNDYSLSLNYYEPNRISAGEILEGDSDIVYWQFVGQQGDILAIAMNDLGDGDPYLRLLDGSGSELAANDDGGGDLNSLIHFMLPEDGLYYIDAGWLGTPDQYSLSLMRIDPEEEPETAAFAMKEGALIAFRLGYIDAGLAFIDNAQNLDDDLELTASEYNIICWFGALWGFPDEVLSACEAAVALDPDNGNIADSRGVARAMTGDFEGAVEDFNLYIEYNFSDPRADQRWEWIEQLEAGINPFDDQALLEELRN